MSRKNRRIEYIYSEDGEKFIQIENYERVDYVMSSANVGYGRQVEFLSAVLDLAWEILDQVACSVPGEPNSDYYCGYYCDLLAQAHETLWIVAGLDVDVLRAIANADIPAVYFEVAYVRDVIAAYNTTSGRVARRI
jgi:hypothetical protein